MTDITIAELFRLQESEDTITPTELASRLREAGRTVSRRTLSFWQSQGLLPPALRAGQRGGVYPAMVFDLALFVTDFRERGVSLETVRELVPAWAHLVAAEANGHVRLIDLERQVRSLDLSREASYLIPLLIEHSLLTLCDDCRSQISWELRDGKTVDGGDGLHLKFVLAEVNPNDGLGDPIAWTQLSLPGLGQHGDLDDPALIVLGIANGIEMRRACSTHDSASERPRRRRRECDLRSARNSRRRRVDQEEVLPLAYT